MIVFTVYKDSLDNYKGFSCKGHAGYGQYGEDIVCSAVSILIINTANAIEAFTNTEFTQSADEGFVEMMFKTKPEADTKLLMDTLLMGMKGIRENHSEYVDIVIRR